MAHPSAAPSAPVTEHGPVPFGVYLHVPFCHRRCGYCAFTTYALGDDEVPDAFVSHALAELRTAARRLGSERPALTSVFFGGGTPTMLSDDQFRRLLHGVLDSFAAAPDLEVTVESNPDGLRPGQLDAWRRAGATRISFGMQSLSARVLRVLDRTHRPERALDAVREAHEAGFEHVNLDLIYGTPGETEADWQATLAAAIHSGVDHVSAYALGIEPATKLAARVRAGEVPAPDDDTAADRYLAADRCLGDAGFEWYEISNWARDGSARCRHNELYWRNHHWWGVGPGAHSHVEGRRWWNHAGLDAWGDAAARGEVPAAGHEVPDADQRRLESVMLGVRLAEGLDTSGLDPVAVDQLRRTGLVTTGSGRLVLTVRGRLLADTVVRTLLADPPR